MSFIPAVLAIEVDNELFDDGDEGEDPYCIQVGMNLSKRLCSHLKGSGHTIPAWVGDGCEEDAWVHLESQFNDKHYAYTIVFFPQENNAYRMAIQYSLKIPFVKRLFKRSDVVDSSDPLHELLREFGAGFTYSRMLSQEEFDALY